MTWPPDIGQLLPRAEAAWYEPVKLKDWVLAERGHGDQRRRVFHIGPEDQQQLGQAIVTPVQGALIATVRDKGTKGIVCSVNVALTIGERSAPVAISWHYASEGSAPRLVTAYITL